MELEFKTWLQNESIWSGIGKYIAKTVDETDAFLQALESINWVNLVRDSPKLYHELLSIYKAIGRQDEIKSILSNPGLISILSDLKQVSISEIQTELEQNLKQEIDENISKIEKLTTTKEKELEAAKLIKQYAKTRVVEIGLFIYRICKILHLDSLLHVIPVTKNWLSSAIHLGLNTISNAEKLAQMLMFGTVSHVNVMSNLLLLGSFIANTIELLRFIIASVLFTGVAGKAALAWSPILGSTLMVGSWIIMGLIAVLIRAKLKSKSSYSKILTSIFLWILDPAKGKKAEIKEWSSNKWILIPNFK